MELLLILLISLMQEFCIHSIQILEQPDVPSVFCCHEALHPASGLPDIVPGAFLFF